jgi:hypothetical protein
MARRRGRRRLAIGLTVALSINAALLALLGPGGRDAGWSAPPTTEIPVRLELAPRSPRPAPSALTPPADLRNQGPPRRSPQPSSLKPTTASTQARSPNPAPPPPQTSPPGLPSPPFNPDAKTAGAQGGGDGDLRARTAFALRKLGACSRMNSGTGDAQDKTLCTRNFAAAADGATVDAIPIGKRADYDAAHAKAGYLVPADAANPNFVTSQVKRGGTVWTVRTGCELVHGKWRCGDH